VHICAVEGNITDQHRLLPPSLLAAKALRRAEECLMQGFTTVRDAGGADYGFREAISEGIYPGPRMLVSGGYISQTGGHGDKRRRAEWIAPVDCCLGMVGSIADGASRLYGIIGEELGLGDAQNGISALVTANLRHVILAPLGVIEVRYPL
jgi:imidazolonepropionase-like amidohydrolase